MTTHYFTLWKNKGVMWMMPDPRQGVDGNSPHTGIMNAAAKWMCPSHFLKSLLELCEQAFYWMRTCRSIEKCPVRGRMSVNGNKYVTGPCLPDQWKA